MSTRFDPTPDPPVDPGLGPDADPDAGRQDDTRSDLMSDQPYDQPYDRPDDLGPEQPAAHRPSVLHLVVGLVFLGLAALWALSASGAVGSDDTWLLPGLLVVAGAAGLVAALAGGRRRTR